MKRNDVIISNAKNCVRNGVTKLGKQKPGNISTGIGETQNELETKNPSTIFY
jgi:hypothetical protein